MVLKEAVLDVAYTDHESTRGYVDVAYTSACSDEAQATLRAARTPGRRRGSGRSTRGSGTRRRNPNAELTPFVVEARGRLGPEVLSFLRKHAPAEEPLRSAVLARAAREISIITQRSLAALPLSAEPRPVLV